MSRTSRRYGSVVQNPSRRRRFGIGERKRAEEIENVRERERQIDNSSLSQWRRWGLFRFATVLCLWVYFVVVAQIGGGVVKLRLVVLTPFSTSPSLFSSL
ncbi:hypothetical protein ACB094_04G088800 [Castanea mollissima]